MDNRTEDQIIRQVAQNSGDDTLEVPMEEGQYRPIYKKFPESRIPISKVSGALWKSRRDSAVAKLEKTGKKANWEEAIRYYKNDQQKGRTGSSRRIRSEKTEGDSENVVFSNACALLPSTYAKNPQIEITSNIRDDNQEGGQDDQLEALFTTCERLANALANRKASPGLNLKPKAKKAVLSSFLVNVGYIEVGYTKREQSSEQALIDLDRLSKELAEAKDKRKIEEVEGALQALEEQVDLLRPSGPWCKYRHPLQVLRDPDSVEGLDDCKWIMIRDFISTAYINAIFREKKSETEWVGVYSPTHVASSSTNSEIDDQITSFSLLKGEETDFRSYGFKDEDTYRSACRTEVYYVWDKITRRVYMYNALDWSWPIWVWDDPYQLDRFFPLAEIGFIVDPEDDIATSEVTYYLDQQDGINEINAEKRRIRKRLLGTVFYNTEIVKDTSLIDAYLSGTDTRSAMGVKAPPDADLSKAFFSILPPAAQALQLLDKQDLFDAVGRLSSVMPIMKGEQFKTNTTNEAISTYNSQQQTRLDEKIDGVEEFVGDIMWMILQMCLQFMSRDAVASILGEKDAANWKNFTPAEIVKTFSIEVVGGSTQKPTSQVKKQAAIQMGQVLGQFTQVGGGTALLLILKVFERAFDEMVISKEDWEALRQSITQAAQAQAQQPQQGQPQQGGEQANPIQQLMGLVDQLPPEAKKALGTALEKGVPMQEALPQIVEMSQQAVAGSA